LIHDFDAIAAAMSPARARRAVAKPKGSTMRLMNAWVRFAVAAGMACGLLMPGACLAQNDVRALTDAYNTGAAALFKQLPGSGNIVLSPLSVGTAMAMALSGARGETEKEMAGALKQRLDRPAMEAANGALRSGLAVYDTSAAPPSCPQGTQVAARAGGQRCEGAPRPDGRCLFPAEREGELCVAAGFFAPSARLLTANALMLAARGDLVAPDYAALLEAKYGAETFRNAGLDDVNAWVKRKTEGKIERILDQLDTSAAAVILNAVYFKAKWDEVFYKPATADDAFNLSPQKKISVPMMRRTGSYALLTRPLYRAIRLPYTIGQLGMIVVLPNEIAGLDAVSRRFAADEWTQLATALHAPDVVKPTELALPRFKASFDADLVPRFRAAGMTRAFDLKRADFSGMTGKPPTQAPLAIGAIVHRAVIEVMEDGTEAAAATAIAMVAASARPQPQNKQVFHVDHPFLFAIVDDTSGAVLFQGRIVDPR
jgi:serpin B